MARVLITEEIAEPGLARLRAAGHQVDVSLGLSADELLGAVGSAEALIIRSATQVTAALLEAAPDLVVVGRAGIGLDNVDVAAATRRGVMVVNAPQSNVLSAAEHTMALLLAQARNIPQAHAALIAGRWERSRWEGVELHGKVLGVIGLGRVGTLVAQRAAAFGMRLLAYDPYVSAERAKQLGAELLPLERVVAEADFLTIHLPKTPETTGLIGADLLARAKPGIRIVNTARGGIVDEKALAQAISRRARGRGRPRRVRAGADGRRPRCSSWTGWWSPPTWAPAPGRPRTRPGSRSPSRCSWRWPASSCPWRSTSRPPRSPKRFGPGCPSPSAWAGSGRPWPGSCPATLDIEFQGGLADHDTRILSLAVLKGLFAVATDEPVSYVNAPQLADERGLEVRSTAASGPGAPGRATPTWWCLRGGRHAVAGTMFGDGEPRVVMVDDHDIELPLARWMLMVHNDDRIGMVAAVATILAEAGCNIVDLKLGRSAEGGTAMMALSFEHPVPAGVTGALRATAGILDAVALADV